MSIECDIRGVEKVPIEAAVAQWAAVCFSEVRKEVNLNLTGRVLNRQTGALMRDVQAVSRVTDDGFQIGTRLVYGIAWEHGFWRKAYEVFPRHAKALHFFAGEEEVFAMKAKIPRQYFKARPFLRPAISTRKSFIRQKLREIVGPGFRAMFPPKGSSVTLKVSLAEK